MKMEKTLVILKPSAIERGLVGEVIHRFESKGLKLVGLKMMQLNDSLLNIHYAHLKEKPFFEEVKKSMKRTPVIVQCWEGVEAAKVVRKMIGKTNGREADAGTIRGDFSISAQENIVHASDSKESAEIEIERFFSKEEIFHYKLPISGYYADSEL